MTDATEADRLVGGVAGHAQRALEHLGLAAFALDHAGMPVAAAMMRAAATNAQVGVEMARDALAVLKRGEAGR